MSVSDPLDITREATTTTHQEEDDGRAFRRAVLIGCWVLTVALTTTAAICR